jgi:hypothetical protein
LADKDGAPTYRDGIGTPRVGDVRTHDGPLELCQSGLHFSRRPIDALTYAPGPWLCRVRVDGKSGYKKGKGVARRREILWIADVTPILRVFARWYVQSVLHLWDPPAPEIVVRWIKTGDESIRAAAWAAARAASGAAAWDTARAASGAAAWNTARAASGAAAGAATGAASEAAQNEILEMALKIALDGRAP